MYKRQAPGCCGIICCHCCGVPAVGIPGAPIAPVAPAPVGISDVYKRQSRKFDRTLKSKCGELREIGCIKRVQPKGALGAGDRNLSIFHNKVNRRVGKRLCNTGEHLAGNNHATRFIHTGGNTMTNRDGVVACLELKNTVFRFDENAGEDGECRCTRNALLYDCLLYTSSSPWQTERK